MNKAYLLALITVTFSQKLLSVEQARYQYFRENNSSLEAKQISILDEAIKTYEAKIMTVNGEMRDFYHESNKIDFSEFNDYSILVSADDFTGVSPNGK